MNTVAALLQWRRRRPAPLHVRNENREPATPSVSLGLWRCREEGDLRTLRRRRGPVARRSRVDRRGRPRIHGAASPQRRAHNSRLARMHQSSSQEAPAQDVIAIDLNSLLAGNRYHQSTVTHWAGTCGQSLFCPLRVAARAQSLIGTGPGLGIAAPGGAQPTASWLASELRSHWSGSPTNLYLSVLAAKRLAGDPAAAYDPSIDPILLCIYATAYHRPIRTCSRRPLRSARSDWRSTRRGTVGRAACVRPRLGGSGGRRPLRSVAEEGRGGMCL